MHVLPMRLQNLWLAVDTRHVEQILGERPWFKVPSAPAEWPGVLAWQGRAVAVLDLALLLELPPLQLGTVRRRTLIAKACDCLLAIPIDEVHEAQFIADSALRPAHATRQAYVSSEFLINDTLMPLFDPVSLVSAALARGETARAETKAPEPAP